MVLEEKSTDSASLLSRFLMQVLGRQDDFVRLLHREKLYPCKEPRSKQDQRKGAFLSAPNATASKHTCMVRSKNVDSGASKARQA